MDDREAISFKCDVLVIGSGIAGTVAALAAAEELGAGGRVTLASMGRLFSGSSFFEGTWGLGLIAPDGEEDEADLVSTILDIGCGVADETLVRSFVGGIEPAVGHLEGWGVRLREPSGDALGQREYIPCFDHKHRRWRGLEHDAMKEAMRPLLESHGVIVCESWELLDFAKDDSGRVCGALFFDHGRGRFSRVACGATVLATGGATTLFERRLTVDDCLATGQAIARRAGCRLVNLEFIQFMPGLVQPVEGVVFNEKTFRYMVPEEGVQISSEELELRSGYGPFTSRLSSSTVDIAIDAAGKKGLRLTPRLEGDLPEFVRVYLDWLERSKGVQSDEDIRVAMYAHACNGGVAVDADGWTGIPGLFAAGEVTGGMHGADRLGGLSSANALVFGMRAGEAASRAAMQRRHADERLSPTHAVVPERSDATPFDPSPTEAAIMHAMSSSCMIQRTDEGLRQALDELRQAADALGEPIELSDHAYALLLREQLRLETARAIVQAALARPESLGSHFRTR